LAFIVGTGNDLLALQMADGFERKLKELKEKQSPSTLFELEIAAVFARAGWSVKFIRESEAKTPDFEISKGEMTRGTFLLNNGWLRQPAGLKMLRTRNR